MTRKETKKGMLRRQRDKKAKTVDIKSSRPRSILAWVCLGSLGTPPLSEAQSQRTRIHLRIKRPLMIIASYFGRAGDS
jgi:hypothetical protein